MVLLQQSDASLELKSEHQVMAKELEREIVQLPQLTSTLHGWATASECRTVIISIDKTLCDNDPTTFHLKAWSRVDLSFLPSFLPSLQSSTAVWFVQCDCPARQKMGVCPPALQSRDWRMHRTPCGTSVPLPSPPRTTWVTSPSRLEFLSVFLFSFIFSSRSCSLLLLLLLLLLLSLRSPFTLTFFSLPLFSSLLRSRFLPPPPPSLLLSLPFSSLSTFSSFSFFSFLFSSFSFFVSVSSLYFLSHFPNLSVTNSNFNQLSVFQVASLRLSSILTLAFNNRLACYGASPQF